jgi:T4 RnlA family RNA ligase
MTLPSEEFFSFKEGIIGMDQCILITPNNIKCKWSEETLQFRSMIVRKYDHKIISRGFDKFFNHGEQPDLDKFPDGPFDVIEKKDGSLIIWGIHNGQIIHRTRGTFDATNMANGHEIEYLKGKYPQLLVAIYNNQEYSILTEWQTKTNVIVINEVVEPTLTLVGAIHNESGKLINQTVLDSMGKAWGLNRPTRYHYNSVFECISDVELWQGKEGVVLYSEDGQKLRKCKSEWYCELHKLATGIKNINQVLDVFMVTEKFTKYEDFYKYIETTIDYEVAERLKEDMLKIVTAYNTVLDQLNKVRKAVDNLRGESFTRKDQAIEITQKWSDWRKGAAFTILDNKVLDDKLIRVAIEANL